VARLFWNEVRIQRREPGLWILIAAYAMLLGYGCLQSVDRVHARQAQIASASQDYMDRWAALRASAEAPPGAWGDWRSPSLVGGPEGFAVTWIPVDGLAVLSTGEAVRQPSVRRVSIYSGDEEPPLENPLAPAGGLFDLSFVVIWLLPLTVVIATHGAVSGDRQLGTWPLIAATSSAPGRVVVARLVWPALLIAGITAIGGSVAVLSAAPLPAAADWLRLGAWWGVVAAYAAFWAVAAGVATARCATAAASLVSLGLFWIALVWVAPGLIDAGVSAAVPPPNRLAAHIADREGQRDLERNLPQLVEAVYQRHPEWRPSAETIAAATKPVPGGPASRDARRVYVPSLAGAEVAAPFAQAAAGRRERTEQLVRRFSVLSPALAMQLIGDHLAGTSSDRFVQFDRHAKAAEATWHAFFAPRIMQLRDMTREDMNQVPVTAAFSARPQGGTVRWPLAGLVLALATVAIAFRRSLPLLRS